jgi:hypothetical protein
VESVSTGSAKDECKAVAAVVRLLAEPAVGWRTKASPTLSRAARRRGEVYIIIVVVLVVGSVC